MDNDHDILEAELRRNFMADLEPFIETIPGKGDARYIPHGVIRSLLLVAAAESRFSYDWHVDVIEHPDGWLATGTLSLDWPVIVDGKPWNRVQVHQDVSTIEQDPATASSRLFCRCVAFSTGLGLQAWDPRGWAMARARLTDS